MEKKTKEIGDFGEKIATDYLRKKGYVFLDRNYSCRFGEIDIIMLDDTTTVFVEVKTRKSTSYGYASEFVDYRKQERIRKTCISYTRSEDVDMRFDIVEVYYKMAGGELQATEINHIENAF